MESDESLVRHSIDVVTILILGFVYVGLLSVQSALAAGKLAFTSARSVGSRLARWPSRGTH